MISKSVAYLFPGQGIFSFDILEKAKEFNNFIERYELISNALGYEKSSRIKQQDEAVLCINVVSSLLTVLYNSLAYDEYSFKNGKPNFLAGYSVGQWTALYASNVVSFKELVEIVRKRAEIMDDCIQNNPSTMIAVIGLPEEKVRAVVKRLQERGYFIELSNINCLGQYTLSLLKEVTTPALEALEALLPKKIAVLPVSGGWHSSLLKQAQENFQRYLDGIDLGQISIPVVDNVTGKFLPLEISKLKIQLARHLSFPVLWETGIKTLIHSGCKEFIEIGYGNTLTKFGFFIDRSLNHLSLSHV